MSPGNSDLPRVKRARLIDVAEAAGTSKPIASRILNNDPTLSVRQELRERVFSAAEKLHYQPNASARSLRYAASHAIGLLIPEITNTVFSTMVRGAFRYAATRDYVVLIAEDFDDQQANESFAQLVVAGRIDGLMISTARPEHPLLNKLEMYHTPHVFLNRAVEGSNRNITMDDAAATQMAVDHLTSLGHRRIAHIAGPLNLDPAQRRAQAFHEYTVHLGLDFAPIEEDNLLETGGAEATERLLGSTPKPTAIFASSVAQATGVLSAAWYAGYRVPHDLSIVAYADTPLAAALIPPLTAVAMPIEKLGVIGAQVLLDQLNGTEPLNIIVDERPHLVVRGSTAPVPVSK